MCIAKNAALMYISKTMDAKESIFTEGKFWRTLPNFWTAVLLAFIVVNFFAHDKYSYLIIPLAFLYTGTLALYVGTKEFERWYEVHESKHPGEWFVIAWSVVMFFVIGTSFALGEEYHIPSDIIVAVYIAVLTLFAFTQKSKSLHRERRGNKKRQS